MNNGRCFFIVLVLASLLASQPAGGQGPTPYSALNLAQDPLDSHAGVELRSNLEGIASEMQLIPPSALGCKNPVYARIKKLSDGTWFLMYHNGRIGSSVWYNLSKDLVHWEPPQLLFSARPTKTPAGDDQWRYSSADAIVLRGGDLLAYVALRANKGYRYYPECNHIAMRRSRDNGRTWDAEEFIYDGTVWEPFMLELPSGKLQCYFTDTEPQKLNSGTSIVESLDGGHTWGPGGVSNCYKVIRQYKYTDEGTPIYTDQMPCVRILNDGHTLLGFMESRLGPRPEKDAVYKMTVVHGHDDWPHLKAGESGPEDRDNNVISGAAGYVSQFPSGETVLSCNLNQIFQLKLGDCTGRGFDYGGWDGRWIKALPEKGFWGATELVSPHVIIGTMHCKTGIQIGRYYLNHRIDAIRQKIRVDGDNGDWPTSAHAWFIGSQSPSVQTSIRAAYKSKKLFFVFDRIDDLVEKGDDIRLLICASDSPEEGFLELRFGPETPLTTSVSGIACQVEEMKGGYVAELAIPVAALGRPSDGCYRVNVTVYDNASGEDGFTWAEQSDPSTWQLLRLKKK